MFEVEETVYRLPLKGNEMKFADFVCGEAIRMQLTADDKESVIREMVGALVEAGRVAEGDKDDILKAILKREELGSTGIGRGVAVPHTKHSSVKEIVGTVGVSKGGIDFRSLDGDKVNLFFMLISPPDRPSDHLRALENIAKQLQNETFCSFLKQSKSVEDVSQLLSEADENHFGS